MRVYSNDFEEAFDKFLDDEIHDQAEALLFSMLRAAFAAGWEAAGGKARQEEHIFQIIKGRGPKKGE